LCSESEPALLAQASSFSACHHASNFTERIPTDHFSLGTQGKARS
jgi:hypothetical protein